MGLREKKARQSRDRVIAEAMALFVRSGYDETTMEAIAEAADISPSTLYRYFPSKDLIVLASFTGNTAKFSQVFGEMVKVRSIEQALAEAIIAVLAVEDERPQHALLVRSLLGQSPVARAKLWDYLGEQQRLLAAQLATALGTEENNPRVILTARISIDILLAAADLWRASNGTGSSRRFAEQLMLTLRNGQVLFPDPEVPRLPQSESAKRKARK